MLMQRLSREVYELLEFLEKKIEDNKGLLDSLGVKFEISGCTKLTGTESGFTKSNISNTALASMVASMPNISERTERDCNGRAGT